MSDPIRWPEGKRFAFTFFDDTDRATVENVKPVYDLLAEHGLWGTKSVWPIAGTKSGGPLAGETCADPRYADWVRQLQTAGFEIGFHNATYHSSPREDTIRALDRFAALFGHDPKVMANHDVVREAIYWGEHRLSGIRRRIYRALTALRTRHRFTGHVPGDPFFWGDVCGSRLKYVRNFVFDDVNTLAACPVMPYYDPDRPYVTAWYASTEGGNVHSFNRSLDERAQDRLEAEGGACIMYTHFAKSFFRDGRLNERFRTLMRRLAAKNGWFVPASKLLDHIADARGGVRTITAAERARLENRWLFERVKAGIRSSVSLED
jgi:hypothetical protein